MIRNSCPLAGNRQGLTARRLRPSDRLVYALLFFSTATSVAFSQLAYRYVPLMALGFYLYVLLIRTRHTRITYSALFAIMFMLWATASLLWHPNLDEAIQPMLVLWSSLGSFTLLMFVRLKDSELRALTYGFITGGAYAAVSILYSYVTGAMNDAGRPIVENININYLSYSLVASLPLLSLIGGRFARLTRTVSFALLATGIILSGTRASLLGLAVYVLWFMITNTRTARVFSSILVFAIIGTFMLVSLGVIDAFLPYLDFGYRATGSLSGRVGAWNIARDFWIEQPITGVGLDAFGTVSGLGHPTHNALLELASTLGVVGVILYALIFVTSLVPITPTTTARRFMGAFVGCNVFAYATGHWIYSIAAWLALVIASHVVQPDRQ